MVVQELHLSVDWDDEAAAHVFILRAFSHAQHRIYSLRSVTFEGQWHIAPDDNVLALDLVAACPDLEHLCFPPFSHHEEALGDNGTTALVNMLAERVNTLLALHISNSQMSSLGAADLGNCFAIHGGHAQQLHQAQVPVVPQMHNNGFELRILDISYNNIASGAEALGCGLQTGCPRLRVLHAKDNQMGSSGATQLAWHVSRGCHDLRVLDISNNNICASGAEALARFLVQGCRSLCKLRIDDNNIGNAGAQLMGQHFAGSPAHALRELSMCRNNISVAIGQALARNLGDHGCCVSF